MKIDLVTGWADVRQHMRDIQHAEITQRLELSDNRDHDNHALKAALIVNHRLSNQVGSGPTIFSRSSVFGGLRWPSVKPSLKSALCRLLVAQLATQSWSLCLDIASDIASYTYGRSACAFCEALPLATVEVGTGGANETGWS